MLIIATFAVSTGIAWQMYRYELKRNRVRLADVQSQETDRTQQFVKPRETVEPGSRLTQYDDASQYAKQLIAELRRPEDVKSFGNAYALYDEYLRRRDWPSTEKVRALEAAVQLIEPLVSTDNLSDDATSRALLFRGNLHLQLAYVQFRSKRDGSANIGLIKLHLARSIDDATTVLKSSTGTDIIVEANNIFGNASEDMFFYGVDVADDRIGFHYHNAEDAFYNAYKLDSLSSAALNLARCTVRYARAKRL